jgi:hypothetical protein
VDGRGRCAIGAARALNGRENKKAPMNERSDADRHANLLEHQLAHDERHRMLERSTALITSGARGLTVLNSGAAVAILGLFSSLAGRDETALAAFKIIGLCALIAFLTGALAATLTFAPHYWQTVQSYHERWDKASRARRWVIILLATSAGCFFTGASISTYGIWWAFH